MWLLEPRVLKVGFSSDLWKKIRPFIGVNSGDSKSTKTYYRLRVRFPRDVLSPLVIFVMTKLSFRSLLLGFFEFPAQAKLDFTIVFLSWKMAGQYDHGHGPHESCCKISRLQKHLKDPQSVLQRSKMLMCFNAWWVSWQCIMASVWQVQSF